MGRCGTAMVWLELYAVIAFAVMTCDPTSVARAADDPPAGDLPAMARAAKSQFRPLVKSDLQVVRSSLSEAADQLNRRLASDKKNGPDWRSYVQLDELQAQLGKPGDLDTNLLTRIYARLAAGYNGLELVWFAELREAVRHYVEVAGGVGNPGVKAAYEDVLERLAGQLHTYSTRPTPESATDISESLVWLESAGQAPALLQAIRARFDQPNFYGQVTAGVMGAGIAGPVDETEPVYDVILGTVIHGTGRTIGETRVALVPNKCYGVFDTLLLATNHSQTVGRNGPVCIYSCGETGIGAAKRFWIDATGMHTYPAVAQAEVDTTITDIQAKRRIIEGIGWRRAEKQKSEAEWIAARHAEQRVNRRIDQQAAPMLEDSSQNYESKIRVPLAERRIFPRQLCFSTTSDFLEARGLEARPTQLAASSPPPTLAESSDVAVRIHQSTFNNAANTALAGYVLREDMLRSTVTNLLGYLPEQMKPDPTKDQEPWTVVFARRDPISVAFVDGGFQATLRGREFYSGDNKYPGMNVTVVYEFVKTDQGIKLVRKGDLQIFPPGFDPASGQRLSARQQAIRTLLQDRLGKVLQQEILPKGFSLKSKRGQAMGKFMPVEMKGGEGWLVLGWRRTGVQPSVPASTTTASR